MSETIITLMPMTLAGETEEGEDTEKSSNTPNVNRQMEDLDASQQQGEINLYWEGVYIPNTPISLTHLMQLC